MIFEINLCHAFRFLCYFQSDNGVSQQKLLNSGLSKKVNHPYNSQEFIKY